MSPVADRLSRVVSRLAARLGGAGDRRLVVAAVIVSTFFVGFGGGVVFPILPNLGGVLGISPFLVGLILSANRFSRLFANAPAGAIVDRIGTRRPFVAGLVIEAVATGGYVIAMVAPLPEVWFMAARILWGFGSALVFATAYTIAADVSDDGTRGANMGLIRGGLLLGFPSGLVLGGIVSELFGTVVAFVVAAAFALLASAVAHRTVPETHVEVDQRESVVPWDVNTSIPALTVGLVNFSLLFGYIGALFASLVLFLDYNQLGVFGFSAQGSSGLFMAVTVLAAGGSMAVGGVISDRRQSRVPTLIGFLTIAGVGFLLLARASSVATLLLACLFIGAGQGGTSGPLMALLADLVPDDQMGRAVGTNNVFGDLGGGFGPMITLPAIELVGFQPVYFASAALPLLAILTLLVGVRLETGSLTPRVSTR